MKVYIDSCIYIDFWQQTRTKYRDFFEESQRLITQCKTGEIHVVYSDWLEYELKHNKTQDYSAEFKELVKTFPQTTYVEKTKEDEKQAKILSKENYPDALHAVLAVREKVNILTSRNKRDFYEFLSYLEENQVEFIPINEL